MKRVGWIERVSLSIDDAEGDASAIKLAAKMDTGAKGCALHAQVVRILHTASHRCVEFRLPGRHGLISAPYRPHKRVRSSNGASDVRPTIHGCVRIGGAQVPATISLCDRSEMEYPLLLGRDFLRARYLVDSTRKFLLSARRSRQARLAHDTKHNSTSP